MSEIRSRLTLDTRPYEQGLNQVNQRTKRFADNTGREGRRAGKEFNRGAREAERGWTGATSRIKRSLQGLTAVIATVFSVQVIRRFTGAVVDALEDLSTYQSRFTALLGDAREADRLIERMRSRRGPTAAYQAMDVTTRLMAADFDEDEAEEQLRRIEDLAASFSDNIKDGVDEFSRHILDLASRPQASYRTLSRLARTSLPIYAALGDEFGKTKEELIEMAKDGAIPAADALRVLNRYVDEHLAGAGESMTGHLTTQLARVRDQVRLLMADLGSVVVPDIAEDFAGLADRMGEDQGIRRILQGISTDLAAIYRMIASITSAVAPLIPTLLRLGTAFLVFKTATTSLNAMRTAAGRLVDMLKGVPAAFAATQGAQPIYVMGAAHKPRPRWDADGYAQMEAQYGISARRQHAIHMANWRRHEQMVLRNSLATREFGNIFSRTMARGRIAMHGFLRGVGALTYALGGWPVVLALVVTALTAVWSWKKRAQIRAEELTRSIREQKKAVDDLVESYDKLDGAQQFSRRRQMEEDNLEAYREQMREYLPEGETVPDNLVDAQRQANRMIALLEADVVIQSRQSSDSGVGFGAPVQREGDIAGESAKARKELQRTLVLWEEWREQLGHAIGATEHLHQEGLQNLAYQLAQVEDVLRPLKEKEVLTPDEDAERVRLVRERNRLRKKLGLRDTDDSDDDPDPDPTQISEPRSLEDLARELQLIKLREELKSQLRDIHDLKDRIALIREQNTHPEASRGQIEAGRELIGLLTGELEAKKEIYTETERILELEEMLVPAVREAAEEFGSLADALALGITTEDLDLVAEITEATKEMEKHLSDIELQLNLDLASTTNPEQRDKLEKAAEDASRIVAQAYQKKLREFIEQMRDNAPPEFRELIDRLFKDMASTISANVHPDDQDPFDRMSDNLWNFVQAGQGLHRIAQDLKLIGEEGSLVAEGLLEAADNADQLIRSRRYLADNKISFSSLEGVMSQLPGWIGIASGVVTAMQGFLSPMFDRGGENALKEMADEMKRSAREISRSIDRYVEAVRKGEDATGRERDSIQKLWDAFTSTVEDARGRTDFGQHHYVERQIEKAFFDLIEGLGDRIDGAALDKLYADLRNAGMAASEAVEAILGGPEALEAIFGRAWFDEDLIRDILGDINLEALIESLLGTGEFSDHVRGFIAQMDFFLRYISEDVPKAFKTFVDNLLSLDEVEGPLRDLLDEAAGLDITTESGRARLSQIIKEIAENFAAYMGGLDADDLEAILDRLTQASEYSPEEGEDWNRNVQFLRMITEAQGNEIVILLKDIAHHIRRIAEGHGFVPAMPQMVSALTASTTPASYSASFGNVNISVSSMDALAQESARELEKAVSQRLRRPF